MAALKHCLVLFMIIYGCSHCVHGYPYGAPQTACTTMAPIHTGAAYPQSSPPPFEITVLGVSYSPNQNLTVILSAPCSTEQYAGFLLEARRADVVLNRDEPLGTFDTPLGTKHVALCGNGRQAVTHVDQSLKSNLVFQWTAPAQPIGHIVFAVTFASSKFTYWVKVFSGVIRESGNAVGPNVGSVAYPTLSTCSVVPTQPPLPTLSPEPMCVQDKKSCFTDCRNQQCGFIVSWTNDTNNRNSVEFELSTIVDRSTNVWMAIGFSSDMQMGEEKVVECVSFNNAVNVYPSYNTITPRLENKRNENPQPSDGIFKNNTSLVDGIFRCSFTVVSKRFSYIDLSTPWHLMFAAGRTATFRDNKLQHSVSPGTLPPVTPNKINFMKGNIIPEAGNATVDPNSGSKTSTGRRPVTTGRRPVTTAVPVIPVSSVKCGRYYYVSVSIPRYLIPTGEYELEDPSCRVSHRLDAIYTSFNVKKCGTVKFVTDKYVFYRNYLTNRETQESILVQCRYGRTRKSISTQISHRNIIRREKGISRREKAYSSKGLSVDVYKSQLFNNSVHAVSNLRPAAVVGNSRIFLRLSINNRKYDHNLQVFPINCRAVLSPLYHQSDPIRLIENGCAVDRSVVVYDGINGDFRFSFRVPYSIYTSSKVTCDVVLCEAADSKSRCARGCLQANSRKMRSVDGDYVVSKQLHFAFNGETSD